jgi:hypothetical protein
VDRTLTPDELEARFTALLPDLRYAAWQLGYALAVHGTMRRDLDLVVADLIDAHFKRVQTALTTGYSLKNRGDWICKHTMLRRRALQLQGARVPEEDHPSNARKR